MNANVENVEFTLDANIAGKWSTLAKAIASDAGKRSATVHALCIETLDNHEDKSKAMSAVSELFDDERSAYKSGTPEYNAIGSYKTMARKAMWALNNGSKSSTLGGLVKFYADKHAKDPVTGEKLLEKAIRKMVDEGLSGEEIQAVCKLKVAAVAVAA